MKQTNCQCFSPMYRGKMIGIRYWEKPAEDGATRKEETGGGLKEVYGCGETERGHGSG